MSITFGEALLYSVLGMLVVFFALILLMCIIKILDKVETSLNDKEAAKNAETKAAAAEEAAPVQEAATAPGTAGDIKLYDTDPRDAAMIMAIVADTMQVPLNELRFISIKAVEE